MAASLEIIEFKIPAESKKNLYITGISGKLSEQEVHEKLYQLFSSYGVLFNVQVFGSLLDTLSVATTGGQSSEGASSDDHSGRSGYYAFVQFYSSQAALKAKQGVSGKYILKGQLLKVRYSRSTKKFDGESVLVYSKCCELASYYLGFNGWSSKILSIQEDKDDPIPNTVRFIGQVMIEIIHEGHGMQSEGVGLGEFTYNPGDVLTRLTAIHRAKKLAYMRACQSAFGKMLLVVLPNGKVAVEVDCTQSSQLDFATDEELQAVVKVNQVEPVEDEEPNDTLRDADNLDDINEQLLLDLQADIE